jgi:putative OPT family oligopeptide transporter
MSDTTAPVHDVPQLAKPADAREWTWFGVVVALLVAAVIGASYPYVVLKLGFGPNIAVVSAFFGFMALSLGPRGAGLRWQSNLAQAAGTTAGQTAFMCSIMAAFDLLTQDPSTGVNLTLTPMQTFLWITTAGLLGAFLAVPFRQHFIVDEKLAYPDGMAAGETLIVLDSRGPEAKRAVLAMVAGLLASAGLGLLVMRKLWGVVEEVHVKVNSFSGVTGVGFSLSLLNLGSGMIVGLRICANMFVGLLISWVIAPPILSDAGLLAEAKKLEVLKWVMWPATGLMIAGGLTALFLKWRAIRRSVSGLSGARTGSSDFPFRGVVIGSILSAIALILVQKFALHLPVWQTAVAILFTLPLMLVGLRVLGETNWGPISALSNLMQGVFGLIVPGSIQANMIASGVTGSVVAESEGVIQSYKTGHMIGSTPRYLTYIQLLAIPVGALVLALVYPVLRNTYGIGGENGLQSPISQKWYSFAKLLSQGISQLPSSAFIAMAIAIVLGVVFTVLEQKPRLRTWVPSPTGIGIGMLIPASAVSTMFVGALIAWYVNKRNPKSGDSVVLPLASGFIAGEALVAVILPLLIVLGWLSK